MNHIGQRIKELRKKNDLTQEALADLLGITYKAVSKWECGLTVPDIALIVPMARLFHVTADELLSGKAVETDMRRMELDEKCENSWKYDQKEMYQLATQAVKEYPGDYKYLLWLGDMENNMAYRDENKKDPLNPSSEMIEKALRYYNMVIEGCTDSYLREKAMWNAMIACKSTEQYDRALTYAKMFPDRTPFDRAKAMAECLQGDKQIAQWQANSYSSLERFCMSLLEVYRFANEKEPHVTAALNTEEAVLKTIFSDGNYLTFHWHLYCIYAKRAYLECREGMYDKAIDHLKTMMEHGKQYVNALATEAQNTCDIFNRIIVKGEGVGLPTIIHDGKRNYDKPFLEAVKDELMMEDVYAPLREREDFKALLIEV